MQNIDIVTAAQNGSLQDVCDALSAGVHVDTTNEVCYTYFSLCHLSCVRGYIRHHIASLFTSQ